MPAMWEATTLLENKEMNGFLSLEAPAVALYKDIHTPLNLRFGPHFTKYTNRASSTF